MSRRIELQAERPKVAVYKFASCDGCQLTLLDCEDELLLLAGLVDFVHFPEAVSPSLEVNEKYDLTLIEGSISTPEQLEEIQHIRKRSRYLVTIGACANTGGIQALRNFADHQAYMQAVYARHDYIASLATSTPISEHVHVDYELRGCPIDQGQLLEVITAYLRGRRPAIHNESVCFECKRRGTVCVVVKDQQPCLGPVTHAGCGAICPAYGRGCYGCFGPKERPNTRAVAAQMKQWGYSEKEIMQDFRLFTGNAPAFKEESERHE